jgi:hypothetical protein
MRFVPLDQKAFPFLRQANERKKSLFKAPWNRTMSLLERELMNLGASEVILEGGWRSDQIRVDGYPYAKATASHPAVILRFRDAENKPLAFPCDRFETWEDNVRAIALSLEALRAVDRFGVTKHSEQYQGFKAIEAAKQWTVDDAAQFLSVKTEMRVDVLLNDSELYRRAYRAAARVMHPDVIGSNPHEWKLLADAKALLDAHHGLSAKAETSA